ncbi:MAG: hypothetical protein WD988_01625 [Candidatus Curtissbacteria bacterium]
MAERNLFLLHLTPQELVHRQQEALKDKRTGMLLAIVSAGISLGSLIAAFALDGEPSRIATITTGVFATGTMPPLMLFGGSILELADIQELQQEK